MGRFFANQKQDEAGVVGVTLQKLLIFFMMLDAVAWVLGMGFFGSLMSFLFHFAVFMGVYRRRTAVLLLYVVFNVIMFVLAAFLLLVVASSMMYVENDDSYDGSSSYSPNSHYNYTTSPHIDYFRSFFVVHPNMHNNTASSSASADSSSSPSHSSASYDYLSSDSYEQYSGNIFLISLIALLLSVVLLYCKILSVVLAHRMRKILLAAPVLPVAQPAQDANVNTDAGDTTPFLVRPEDGGHPFFTQPGFLPYHPMQAFYPGQGQAMMPPPFMYGQHPVFYSFAPQQQTPSDEKL